VISQACGFCFQLTNTTQKGDYTILNGSVCFIMITDLKKRKLLNGPACEVKAALKLCRGNRCHFTMGDVEDVVSVSLCKVPKDFD